MTLRGRLPRAGRIEERNERAESEPDEGVIEKKGRSVLGESSRNGGCGRNEKWRER